MVLQHVNCTHTSTKAAPQSTERCKLQWFCNISGLLAQAPMRPHGAQKAVKYNGCATYQVYSHTHQDRLTGAQNVVKDNGFATYQVYSHKHQSRPPGPQNDIKYNGFATRQVHSHKHPSKRTRAQTAVKYNECCAIAVSLAQGA